MDVQILLQKLTKRNIPPLLLHIISSLFTQCCSRVVVNGQVSEAFQRNSGLFQGSILSPWLFDVYIDDLAEELSRCQDPRGLFPCALLFADDVQLLASSNAQAQVLTEVVVKWAKNNIMKVNIAKSAVCSVFKGTQVFLDGEALPQLATYKYLGLPHSWSTIRYKDHLSRGLSKAQGLFKFVQQVSAPWPPWVRLTIYRTFIQPIMDYGAPLVWHWCQALPSRLKILNGHEEFQTECLRWVFSKSQPLSVLQSVSGIPTFQTRFEGMATTFTTHVSALHHSNPLFQVLGAHRPPPWPDEFLSPRCSTTAQLQRFHHRQNPDVKLPTFIRWEYCQAFQSGALTAGIWNSCRINHYGTDRLMYLKETEVQTLGIRWRCGQLGLHYTCPCQERFSRVHLNSCSLLKEHPSLTPLATQRWKREHEEVGLSTPYTILDSLLNHCDYENFYSCCVSLLEMLMPPPGPGTGDSGRLEDSSRQRG